MARFGMTGETGALVEIDLTGAPHGSLETLSRTALDTLRFVVEWIVPAAGFLANTSEECHVLEVLSPGGGLAALELGGAR